MAVIQGGAHAGAAAAGNTQRPAGARRGRYSRRAMHVQPARTRWRLRCERYWRRLRWLVELAGRYAPLVAPAVLTLAAAGLVGLHAVRFWAAGAPRDLVVGLAGIAIGAVGIVVVQSHYTCRLIWCRRRQQ